MVVKVKTAVSRRKERFEAIILATAWCFCRKNYAAKASTSESWTIPPDLAVIPVAITGIRSGHRALQPERTSSRRWHNKLAGFPLLHQQKKDNTRKNTAPDRQFSKRWIAKLLLLGWRIKRKWMTTNEERNVERVNKNEEKEEKDVVTWRNGSALSWWWPRFEM